MYASSRSKVDQLLVLRGVSEEMVFSFSNWLRCGYVILIASCMHQPTYKLHTSETIAKHMIRKESYDLAWSSPRWAGFCRFSSNQNQCFVPPLRAHSMLGSSTVDGWIGARQVARAIQPSTFELLSMMYARRGGTKQACSKLLK